MAKPTPSVKAFPTNEVAVTTSDFVRHFGLWQERAAREPVYILHRGRPRFVMTSVETMQQLCARHQVDIAATTVADGALLDLVDDIILILDFDFCVHHSTAAARRYFGGELRGTAITHLVDATGAQMLTDTLRRVAASGLAEELEVAAPFPGRRLSFSIVIHPGGIALAVRDVSVVADLASARAHQHAADSALAATGLGTNARLNVRGHIVGTPSGLAALADIEPAALNGVRFASLIERATRIAVADAIDGVLGDGVPRGLNADLLVGGQATLSVRIGMAAMRAGATVEGLTLTLIGPASLKET